MNGIQWNEPKNIIYSNITALAWASKEKNIHVYIEGIKRKIHRMMTNKRCKWNMNGTRYVKYPKQQIRFVYVTIYPRQPRIECNTPKCQTFIIIHYSSFCCKYKLSVFQFNLLCAFFFALLLHYFEWVTSDSLDANFSSDQILLSIFPFCFCFCLLVYSSFREFGCLWTIGVF